MRLSLTEQKQVTRSGLFEAVGQDQLDRVGKTHPEMSFPMYLSLLILVPSKLSPDFFAPPLKDSQAIGRFYKLLK